MSDVIRQEFADRLVATDEENKRVKNEMSELKARHKIEVERTKAEVELVQKAKEEEMEGSSQEVSLVTDVADDISRSYSYLTFISIRCVHTDT